MQISESDYKKRDENGETQARQFGRLFHNYSDAAVYGGLRLKWESRNVLSYAGGAEFNYEHHDWEGEQTRNALTAWARYALGDDGQSFHINLTGTVEIFW